MEMKPLSLLATLFPILFWGCFTTSSDKDYKLTPDLTIGNNWLYQFRQFSKAENGENGDTLIYFIHYKIIGDTLINDSTYRLMAEEDLAIFDARIGINTTLNAVKFENGDLVIKKLKLGGGESGRYPLKAGASVFDTLNFRDEVVALSFPIRENSEWYFRDPGHPLGHGPVKKIFLGIEPINSLGSTLNALKFEFIMEDMEWIKTFEWYSESIKIKSMTFSKANHFNNDSAFFEEEYIGIRGFSKEDSQTVLESYRKWSQSI